MYKWKLAPEGDFYQTLKDRILEEFWNISITDITDTCYKYFILNSWKPPAYTFILLSPSKDLWWERGNIYELLDGILIASSTTRPRILPGVEDEGGGYNLQSTLYRPRFHTAQIACAGTKVRMIHFLLQIRWKARK